MNGFRKRIVCSLLALYVVAAAVLSCPLKVQATAALPAEGSVESLMALLDILINASAVGGATDYVANYDSDMALLDAFAGFVWSTYPGGAPPELDATFYLEDGTAVTVAEVLDGVEDGTVTLPNEQQWGQYRVGFGDDFASILEAWESRGGGSGGGSSQEPDDPNFSTLDAIILSSGFMGIVENFFSALWNDEIEGVDPAAYFDLKDYIWRGKYDKDVSSYPFKGNISYSTVNNPYISSGVHNFDTFASYPPAVVIDNKDGTPVFNFYYYNNAVCGFYMSWKTLQFDCNGNFFGSCSNHSNTYSFTSDCNLTRYNFNVPVFGSYSAMEAFYINGDDSGILNGLKYDYSALMANISAAFAPWTSTRISPATLQKTYSGVKSAYETQIKPQTDTSTEADTETNTKTYTETINKVIPENLVQPETGTGTETGTETDPGTETNPGTETDPGTTTPGTGTETSPDEDVDKYKRDLRMVFPFCLPFDLIALLDALDADPVTPCFDFPFVVESLNIDMVVKLDLSFLDDVAEMMRLFETIGFIISLITITHKMIKW